MSVVRLATPKDEILVRKWRHGDRKWRVTLVGGIWRLEERIAGVWWMVRPDTEALALLDVFVDGWAANLRLQYRWAKAEQKAAIAGGDVQSAERWGAHVRTVRAKIASLPDPHNRMPREGA